MGERRGDERFYRGAFRYISYNALFTDILYPPIRDGLRKTDSGWEYSTPEGVLPWDSDLEVLAGHETSK